MAPPHKRRRVSYTTSQDSSVSEDDVMPRAHFSHGIEHLSHAHTVSGLRQVPQHIEEVHLQIHEQAIGAADVHQRLHRRQQGTATSSEPTSVTVVTSTGTDGTTTSLSTVSGTTDDISSYASSTAESSPAPSSTGTAFTSTASDTSSASSSDNSTDSSTTATSSSANLTVASTASGFIGLSPSGTAPSTTASATSSNGTGSASALSSGVLSSSTSVSGGASSNLTTSALIVQGSSTTYTTRTTINLASETTRSSSQSSESSSHSSSLGAFVYIATLADGRLATISQSDRPYVTTFSGGQVSTIPAASSSLVTTTGDNGQSSTYYETVTPSGGSYIQSTITSTAMVGGAGAGGQQGTATSYATSSSSTSSASVQSGNSNNSNTPPAGTIAGGVVGGAAGLAVILLIAMLFLRWYRRKSQQSHQALPPNTGVSPDLDEQTASVSRGPGMAERAGLIPALGAVPAFFRHQNRSSEGPSESGERGFTRVSGRKLPSSFSPGMSSPPPPTMPLTGGDRNLSTTSFYRDSQGFYGGESGESGNAIPTSPTGGAQREEMTLSPGPQRRPTVHAGGPYVMSPTATESSPTSPRGGSSTVPSSPPRTAGTIATFDRSDTPSSIDPNRSSRFTEEV